MIDPAVRTGVYCFALRLAARSGPDADELKRVWAEASQRKSLPMQWTEKTKLDGNLKTTRKSKEVAKGDEEYPAAVWSYLESGHGYLVNKE